MPTEKESETVIPEIRDDVMYVQTTTQAWECMPNIRWLDEGDGLILQQAWRDQHTGEIEWRGIDTVIAT